MYSLVLSATLDPNECTPEEIQMTRQILGIIIGICEPLHLSDLAKLLEVTPNDILENLDQIRDIINAPPSDLVLTFHASFFDFFATLGHVLESVRTVATAH